MYSLKNNDPCPLATSSLQKVNTFVVITALFSSIIVAHTFAPLSNIVYFWILDQWNYGNYSSQLPKWLLVTLVSWSSLPTLNQGWSVWSTCKAVTKDDCSSGPVLSAVLSDCSLCREHQENQAVLWRCPCEQEARPPRSSQHRVVSLWLTTLEEVPQSKSTLQMAVPHKTLVCNLMSNPEPGLFQAPPKYRTHRNHEQ